MNIVELDLSFSGPFAPLADAKENLNICVNHLPDEMAEPIKEFFRAFTGEELKSDEAIFRLVVREDKPPKLYGPAFYQDEGNFVIRWGNVFIPMVLKDGSFVPEKALDTELEFAIKCQPSADFVIGRYKEPCLVFSLLDCGVYDEILFPISFKRADWEVEFNERQISTALRKNDVELFRSLVAQVTKGGGYISGEVFGNDVLPQGVDLEVIDAVSRNTKFGVNFIITIKANPEVGIENDLRVWAFSQVKNKLRAGAVVSPENPGILNFVSKIDSNTGDKRYDISFEPDWKEAKGVVKMEELLATW